MKHVESEIQFLGSDEGGLYKAAKLQTKPKSEKTERERKKMMKVFFEKSEVMSYTSREGRVHSNDRLGRRRQGNIG